MGLMLKDKRVSVIGMGRSALGAARLLLREEAHPFVSDAKDGPALAPWRDALDVLGVRYEVGGHTSRAWEADIVVLSPGVPSHQPMIQAARGQGIRVMSELELGHAFCRSKLLAVTGTNGKTTTTELLRHLIETCGHSVALAGNNATPLSEAVLIEPAPEYMVLEVSSYQLETCDQFRPWIAAVLNVTPDHLARHGTMEEYARTKERLFARQGEGDVSVVNADDPWTARMRLPEKARRLSFSVEGDAEADVRVENGAILAGKHEMARVADVPLPGAHNLENVLAALTMLHAGGFPWEKCLLGLRTFRGVEHRIELVAEHDGVRYYNDSKSTNVDSLRVALQSFEEPVVLIAGGQGKEGSDYRALLPLLQAHVKRVVLMGQEAPVMAAAWREAVPIEHAAGMREAVEAAAHCAAAGDVVLLSPGCASFDRYNNFEERGQDFKARVHELSERAAAAGGNKP